MSIPGISSWTKQEFSSWCKKSVLTLATIKPGLIDKNQQKINTLYEEALNRATPDQHESVKLLHCMSNFAIILGKPKEDVIFFQTELKKAFLKKKDLVERNFDLYKRNLSPLSSYLINPTIEKCNALIANSFHNPIRIYHVRYYFKVLKTRTEMIRYTEPLYDRIEFSLRTIKEEIEKLNPIQQDVVACTIYKDHIEAVCNHLKNYHFHNFERRLPNLLDEDKEKIQEMLSFGQERAVTIIKNLETLDEDLQTIAIFFSNLLRSDSSRCDSIGFDLLRSEKANAYTLEKFKEEINRINLNYLRLAER